MNSSKEGKNMSEKDKFDIDDFINYCHKRGYSVKITFKSKNKSFQKTFKPGVKK